MGYFVLSAETQHITHQPPDGLDALGVFVSVMALPSIVPNLKGP